MLPGYRSGAMNVKLSVSASHLARARHPRREEEGEQAEHNRPRDQDQHISEVQGLAGDDAHTEVRGAERWQQLAGRLESRGEYRDGHPQAAQRRYYDAQLVEQ